MRIGIDLMGSESSPQVLFDAVLSVAEKLEASSTLVVYATKGTVETLLSDPRYLKSISQEGKSRVDLHIVSESISMDDEPLSAVRLKKDSSLVVGIQQLSEHKIDAFVCAGNTGALIASATITLPLLPRIERSALLAVLPTQKGALAMVDVGGTVSCKAHHLLQYAHMGAAYQRCCLGMAVPTVGLLNIGIESKKGTEEVREAYRILSEESQRPNAKIKFLGNIEGREVFQGKVDVLVTDGFTGNILLKTSEGISSFIFEYLQDALSDTASAGFKLRFENIQRHFSYDAYPGAIVCGVDGVLVKCHGAANKEATINSIQGAITLVKNNLVKKIKEELGELE